MGNDVLWSWISASSSVGTAQKAAPTVAQLFVQTCSYGDNAEEASQKQMRKWYSERAAAVQAQRPKAAALSNTWVFRCCP